MPGASANNYAVLAAKMGMVNGYNLPEAGKNLPPGARPAQGEPADAPWGLGASGGRRCPSP